MVIGKTKSGYSRVEYKANCQTDLEQPNSFNLKVFGGNDLNFRLSLVHLDSASDFDPLSFDIG
jgi:hypothetical protein